VLSWLIAPSVSHRVVARTGLAALGHDSAAVFRAAGKVGLGTHVVDSTKNVSRLVALATTPGLPFFLIRLRRDVRAVAASSIRRTGELPGHAARAWVRTNRWIDAVSARIDAPRIYDLAYEDLCRDPDRVVQSIAAWLGLAQRPLPALLEVGHQIPGNPVLLSGINAVHLDERWRSDLGPAHCAEIMQIAGRANRRYGYRDD
jgi:hypothetical protein